MKILQVFLCFLLLPTLYKIQAKTTANPKKPPTLFRITKVRCEVFDKTWARVNLCECRPIRRGLSVFNMNITMFRVAKQITIIVQVKKKDGWYKPFLFNYTIDACDYVKRHNHPIINMIYDQLKHFSNVNHTCPYVGDQLISGFYTEKRMLKNLPLPNGDYGLFLTWIFQGVKAVSTNVFFEFNNYDF